MENVNKEIDGRLWKRKTALFLTAQTVSLFGSSLVQYAIIWYITLTTQSGAMLTISTACGFVPQILISLFGGVWVDRYNRKRLVMLTDTIIAISTLLLAVSFMLGQKSIWLVFAVLIVRSAGTGIQTPCVNALIPQLVPQDKLMRVNGINTTLMSITSFVSPAVSGLILSISSIETTFFIDVATACIGVGITACIAIPRHKRSGETAGSAFREMKQGFAYLKVTPAVRNLLIFQLFVLVFVSPSAFLTPLMVSRTFGPEVWRLTASEMFYSVGAMAGGLLMSTWGGFKNRLKSTAAAGICYGLLMIAMGVSPLFIVYLCFNLLIGVMVPCYNTPITVMIQERVDTAMQGRVFSFMQIAISCSFPFGMLIFGPLADVLSVQLLLIVCGFVVALTALYAFFSRHFRV